MKKLIAIIVASVTLLAVLGVGISHVIKANNKESEIVSGELAKYSQVEYFESNQRTEQPAVLRAWAVGEKQFTKITYQIDTQSEVVVAGATYDKVSESWSKYNDDFEDLNYIDTGVITIDLSSLDEGKHIVQVRVYAGSDVTECIMEKIFTIQ